MSQRPAILTWLPVSCVTAQLTTAHWSPARMPQPIKHQRTHLVQIKPGLGPVSDLCTCRPAALQANNTHQDTLESLNTAAHTEENASTWHTLATSILLIKEERNDEYPPAYICQFCSSSPDLFCVLKLNSQIKHGDVPPAEFSLLSKTTRTRYPKPCLFFTEYKTADRLRTVSLPWAQSILGMNKMFCSGVLGADEVLPPYSKSNVRSCYL